MDFEKEKQAILRKQERQWGSLPHAVREAIEDKAGSVYEFEDLEYFERTVADDMRLIAVALRHMGKRSKRQSGNELGEATTMKHYQRCFEKRLHLVEFVAEHGLTVKSLLEGTFSHHKRFNWKQICADWNEAHPFDPMTPLVLKATYYRAIAQPDIQQEYFDRRYNEIVEKIQPIVTKIAEQLIRVDPSLGREQAESMATQVLESYMEEFTTDSDWSDYIKELMSVCEEGNSFFNSMSDSEEEELINRLKEEGTQ